MSPLEQAAIDYVAARLANEGTDPSGQALSVVEVDRCWSALCLHSGLVYKDSEESSFGSLA